MEKKAGNKQINHWIIYYWFNFFSFNCELDVSDFCTLIPWNFFLKKVSKTDSQLLEFIFYIYFLSSMKIFKELTQ